MPWTTITAGAAIFVAVLAFLSDRWFRRRDALLRLLERFEAAGFYVLIWRGEMRTRRGELWSLDRVAVGDLSSNGPGDRGRAAYQAASRGR